MPAEDSNILRRLSLAGELESGIASMAYADFLSLRLDLFDYSPFAERIWELRHTVTSYDAWYVALAEALGTELFTLDARLARASGPQCSVRTPGGSQ